MKALNFLLVVIFSLVLTSFSQNLSQVSEYPSQGVKIYSLRFFDSDNGLAESFLGNQLQTTDGGKTWNVIIENQEMGNDFEYNLNAPKSWSADIYCAIMLSSDGGESWIDYPKKQQEHFCQVYFEDNNTGWKVAEEFLSNVIDTIVLAKETGEFESKIGVVFKCREYYTDIDEGWTLGWCYKNLTD